MSSQRNVRNEKERIYLAFRRLVLLNAETCLCHRFLDHTDWVWPLGCGFHTLFCDEGRDFLPQ